MENSNIVRIKAIVGIDTANKVYKLLDFTNEKKDIADPWYTGNFTKTYEEVLKGCQALYNYLTKEWLLCHISNLKMYVKIIKWEKL